MSRNKIKKIAANHSVSRAKYQCPIELQKMIELVRLVPPKISLIPLVELYRDEIDEEMEQGMGGIFAFIFSNRREVYFERVLRRLHPDISPVSFLLIRIAHTPQEFKDYISVDEQVVFNNPFFEDENLRVFTGEDKKQLEETYIFIKMMCKYTDFYQTRLSLQIFANCLESEGRPPRPLPSEDKQHYFEIPLGKVFARRESDGKLHLTGLAKFIEDGFDDSRLRKCIRCQHIFWAKRTDSKTCSKQCLNAYNVQRHRNLSEEEKTVRRLNRINNQNLVKSGKAKTAKRK